MEAALKALLPAVLVLLCAGCDLEPQYEHYPGTPSKVLPLGPGEKIEVPPPPFTEGQFPCTDCHDPEVPVNTQRRQLETAHTEIVLHHDETHRWCHDCPSATNFDKLHLASGELVDFGESYQLCGQCHGDKYRDWRVGVHGRRTGMWNGKKQYLLCVNCHSAHDPKFKPLDPKPAPVRPGDLRQKYEENQR